MNEWNPERDGSKWEITVKNWLRLRYPNGALVTVPADHGGDCGIEAFCRDGIAFQCYAPKQSYKVADLYELQRKKMTDDIEKFIRRKNDLIKIFGTTVITSWWLIVPEHKSAKLVQHANTKTKEVLAQKLPYASDDFFIHIADIEEFSSERTLSIKKGIAELNLGSSDPKQGDIQEWTDTHNTFIETLDRKIRAYTKIQDLTTITKIRNDWIRCFITSENAFKKLQLANADLWEELRAVKQRKENTLFLNYSSESAGHSVLKETITELKLEIKKRLPNLSDENIEEIALGTISDWLQRCPLNFPQ